jgi:DNA-binding response OmpR family regulator
MPRKESSIQELLSLELSCCARGGYEVGTFTRTVNVHVASLRQKLEEAPKRPRMILPVPVDGL